MSNEHKQKIATVVGGTPHDPAFNQRGILNWLELCCREQLEGHFPISVNRGIDGRSIFLKVGKSDGTTKEYEIRVDVGGVSHGESC